MQQQLGDPDTRSQTVEAMKETLLGGNWGNNVNNPQVRILLAAVATSAEPLATVERLNE